MKETDITPKAKGNSTDYINFILYSPSCIIIKLMTFIDLKYCTDNGLMSDTSLWGQISNFSKQFIKVSPNLECQHISQCIASQRK